MATGDWTGSFFDRSYVQLLAAQKDDATTREEVDFLVDALELTPPGRVLDVACGFGRHGIELARRGFEVLGVDASRAMLREARHRARGTRGVRFAHGDMRRLRFAEEFDAVVNMFTSFGYFTHRENLATLRGMARALVPGGRIVIETIDPRALARQLQRAMTHRLWWEVPPDHYILEEVALDARRNVLRSQWKTLEREGLRWTMRPSEFRLKLYDRSEWKAMFDRCDLRKLAEYGGCSTRAGERKMAGARIVLLAARRRKRRARARNPAR